MAGETARISAVCLEIRPWSRTSHIVSWITPTGMLTTVVKGAARPKSLFLGQYDLNYTCELLYYLRAKGEVHALREAYPVSLRENLRSDYRLLALAGYFRALVARLSPQGPDARAWFELLEDSLDALANGRATGLEGLIAFELKGLHLLGLDPEIEASNGALCLRGERRITISDEVARVLGDPFCEKNRMVLLDAVRVIGVYYQFHVDGLTESRRAVQRIL